MPLSEEEFEQRLAAGLGVWPAGTVFLAALSGGADSTALAAGLSALKGASAAAFTVHCLHVNHNIRDEAECAADESAVKALCRRLSQPLLIRRAAPGAIAARARIRGLEDAARQFRHAALQAEARRLGARAILIAHTKNDLLETTLMAVLRGAGPAGLGAWHLAAAPAKGRVPIVRPMLALDRDDVIAYLTARGLSWREDPSNADTRFLRNRVRRVLIPLLDAEFPHWRAPLLQFHETQAMTADFLAAEALRALSWQPNTFTEPVRRKKDSYAGLSVIEADFFAQSPVIREEALFQALDTLGAVRPRRKALRSFAGGRQSACDLGTVRLERSAGYVSVKRVPAAGERGFSVLIKKPGVYKLDGWIAASGALVLTARERQRGDDAGRGFYASFPFALRTARGGVCCEVRDREGRAALFDLHGKFLEKRDDPGEATVILEAAF